MINYLTHETFTGYDESLKPSEQKYGRTGGGMATKTVRVIEALKRNYPTAKTITNASDINADVVLIEPLRFTMEQIEGCEENDDLLDLLEASDAYKILYCSEKAIFRTDPMLYSRLFHICDVITVNCDFMRGLMNCLPKHPPIRPLCDPIPDEFFFPGATKKKKQVIATGQIDWHKNVTGLIEVYEQLKGVVERKYIGSVGLWRNADVSPLQNEMQSKLYAQCDTVIEEAGRAEIAEHFQESMLGLWVAYHDTFASGLHEMLRCGVLVTAANHGLSPEVPVIAASGVANQVAQIKELLLTPPEVLEKQAKQVADRAKERCSYDTFQSQFQTILSEI